MPVHLSLSGVTSLARNSIAGEVKCFEKADFDTDERLEIVALGNFFVPILMSVFKLTS